MPADAGIRFGQYVLLRRIARGGMAEVFLAQQRGLEGFDRRVAVKRILPHLVDSPDFVKMFLGEAKLAAQLTHPNVVHIYDFGKVENDYFIAMEFVDGVHTGQIFKLAERERERLSPTLIARIGADAASALNYAHELTNPQGKPLGLVHRDVSPANIMVSYDGVVKLCDFGIAKAAALSDQLTNPGQVKGKYAYMSPEQTIAAPLDGRSDVFSLAIVLWELLSGKTIVPRGDAVDAMRAIRDGKLPTLSSVAPNVPAPLAKAVMWALETKRERRATAADLSTALEAFIKASPELATPMQLAAWVRLRFPRAETGPQSAINSPSAGSPGTSVQGTQASPSTMAAPGTVGAPGTRGSQIALTPPSRGRAAAMAVQPDVDEDNSATVVAVGKPEPSEGATMIDSPMRQQMARVSQATVIDDSGRAAVETTERDGQIVEDTLSGSETVMLGSAPRPFVRNEGPLPTQLRAAIERRQTPVPTPTPRSVIVPSSRPTPTSTEATMGVRRQLSRRFIAIGAMVALAVISFLIVLAAKSGSQPPQAVDAGVVVTAADAQVAVDAASVRPDAGVRVVVPSDAREPTIGTDASADTTTILKVNTRPPNGTVKVGDQTRTAPAEFALPAGKHVVIIELDGWQAERRVVDLPYGVDTLLEMAFTKRAGGSTRPPTEKQMGKLTVRTIPWSDVYIGTRKIGQAPFADMAMPAGSYTLLFKHPSHKPVRRTVTITPNRTTKLGFNLP
ncbi:MAG: protein kinase [Deltaproteobacteria bacterium]|nr:protein kinase [Deltaproteobacteria bacterium]